MAARVQAVQEIAAQAGQSAEAGTKILEGLAKRRAQVATQTKEISGAPGVKVMRGAGPLEAGTTAQAAAGHMERLGAVTENTVKVFRGGVGAIQDFSEPLKVIGVDLTKIRDGADAAQQKDKAVIQGFLQWAAAAKPLPEQLNEVSKALFNLTAPKPSRSAGCYRKPEQATAVGEMRAASPTGDHRGGRGQSEGAGQRHFREMIARARKAGSNYRSS